MNDHSLTDLIAAKVKLTLNLTDNSTGVEIVSPVGEVVVNVNMNASVAVARLKFFEAVRKVTVNTTYWYSSGVVLDLYFTDAQIAPTSLEFVSGFTGNNALSLTNWKSPSPSFGVPLNAGGLVMNNCMDFDALDFSAAGGYLCGVSVTNSTVQDLLNLPSSFAIGAFNSIGFNFNNCALSSASVETLLSTCYNTAAYSGLTTGTVLDITGGSNAAPIKDVPGTAWYLHLEALSSGAGYSGAYVILPTGEGVWFYIEEYSNPVPLYDRTMYQVTLSEVDSTTDVAYKLSQVLGSISGINADQPVNAYSVCHADAEGPWTEPPSTSGPISIVNSTDGFVSYSTKVRELTNSYGWDVATN